MFGLEWYQYMLISLCGGNLIYFGVGGSIHYYYYHLNRDKSDQWKMQPKKFLSDKLAKQAMLLGTFNLNCASAAMGVLGWGIIEHGWGQIYYDFNDYSLGWAFLSVFLAFFFIEACAYYMHALGHLPWPYKHIHKAHHVYTAPTFWTISALHPLEWIAHSSYIFAPAFLFPMHWSLYLFVVMVPFLYGFWDHSGIKLNINLPFHGSNNFHDDHHKYFHVNYGFLTPYFDRIHNTARREGHHYNEDTFMGGKGRVKVEELGEYAVGDWVDYATPWKQRDANVESDKPIGSAVEG